MKDHKYNGRRSTRREADLREKCTFGCVAIGAVGIESRETLDCSPNEWTRGVHRYDIYHVVYCGKHRGHCIRSDNLSIAAC